jgi:putative transposase
MGIAAEMTLGSNISMPRQPRYFIPDIPQHVIQRGVDRQVTFFQQDDYDLYLSCLHEAAIRYDCAIHAYVLMTNHVHLLLTPGTSRSLPHLMQAMGRGYVQKINRKYRRTGTLWQGRYKASLVQSDEYLLACMKYIEMNPVRSGMVRHPCDYAHSSYACNANGRLNGMISSHSLYVALGRTEDERLFAYRRLFSDRLSEDKLMEIRATTNACMVLGHDRFKDQIESMLDRSVRPKHRGRPRKKGAPHT